MQSDVEICGPCIFSHKLGVLVALRALRVHFIISSALSHRPRIWSSFCDLARSFSLSISSSCKVCQSWRASAAQGKPLSFCYAASFIGLLTQAGSSSGKRSELDQYVLQVALCFSLHQAHFRYEHDKMAYAAYFLDVQRHTPLLSYILHFTTATFRPLKT